MTAAALYGISHSLTVEMGRFLSDFAADDYHAMGIMERRIEAES